MAITKSFLFGNIFVIRAFKLIENGSIPFPMRVPQCGSRNKTAAIFIQSSESAFKSYSAINPRNNPTKTPIIMGSPKISNRVVVLLALNRNLFIHGILSNSILAATAYGSNPTTETGLTVIPSKPHSFCTYGEVQSDNFMQ